MPWLLTKIAVELEGLFIFLCILRFDNGTTRLLRFQLVVVLPFWLPHKVDSESFFVFLSVLILSTDGNELIKTPLVFLS